MLVIENYLLVSQLRLTNIKVTLVCIYIFKRHLMFTLICNILSWTQMLRIRYNTRYNFVIVMVCRKTNYCNCVMPPRSKIGGHIVFVLSVILPSFCHSVLLSETLTLLITFEQRVLELWYVTWIFSVIRSIIFYPVTLTLEFDPFFENFNLAYNFWTVGAKALIFHMNILCDKTFPWVPLLFTLWPLPWGLTYFLKV